MCLHRDGVKSGMLKWPAIAEAWTYRDPQEIGDALLRRSGAFVRRPGCELQGPAPCVNRDRYYRQARRLHVLRAMEGAR